MTLRWGKKKEREREREREREKEKKRKRKREEGENITYARNFKISFKVCPLKRRSPSTDFNRSNFFSTSVMS